MAELVVTGTDAEGNAGSVTIEVVKDGSAGETIITGDFGGLIPAGTTARLRGDVNFTDNMHVRGTLTCDETGVNLNGNGFDIHTHDGTLNLVGTEKTAWCNWGDLVVGWQVGDRLGVAPTKVGVYTPTEITWQGSWAATTRPVNSPAVTLLDGRVMQPEVANLSQTVVLRNLQRIMIHEATAPNPQTFKWIKVLDSGQTSVLRMYPIHFHQIYDHSRGSFLEGVVVEGGKNHAYVPHGSHGITFKDCVAYKTVEDAFWWDTPEEFFPPPGTVCVNCEPGPLGAICSLCKRANDTGGREHHVANNTDDCTWDHCLVLDLNSTEPFNPFPLGGFLLGAGKGNKCINSAAAAIRRGTGPSGYHWPSQANRNDGGNTWEFHDNVTHNNQFHGVFVWQNTPDDHDIDDLIVYRVGRIGIDHGSYVNHYRYRNVVVDGAGTFAMTLHPVSVNGEGMLFEDCRTNGVLKILGHQVIGDGTPTTYRRCTFTKVVVDEVGNFQHPSLVLFEECGLAPANFQFISVVPSSIFELWEGGVLAHRWTAGVWS